MIRVDKDTALTVRNLSVCYNVWRSDYDRIKQNDDIYTNKAKLKLPFGKKLTTISAAATLGDGITLSAAEGLDGKQQATFDAIQELFKAQTIVNHDGAVISNMCKHGRTYEYIYMSEDEVPIPKTARYTALCAFVVFDNTAEANSLFGCYVDSYNKNGKAYLRFTAFDKHNIYEVEQPLNEVTKSGTDLSSLDLNSSGSLPELNIVSDHVFGRVPMTEILNNDEEQADFEQAIALMRDRTDIHNINYKDMHEIAKNYIKARNIKIAGDTEDEKNETQRKAAENQRMEIETDGVDPNDDVNILSKNENYSSITEFGKDADSKIYDLSMVPDLSSQEFAGNLTGVAIKYKLFPFKELVKTKNGELEKMYRRRLKMYMAALIAKDSGKYEEFDIAQCTITFNRSWLDNELELAQMIAQLAPTGLYSDKYLTNKMPDADYDDEQAQIAIEREEKAKHMAANPDPNNFSLEGFNGLFRGMNNDDNNTSQ